MEPLQAGFSHFFPSHVMDRAQNAYVGGMGNIFHPELGSSVFSAHSHPQTLPSTLPGTPWRPRISLVHSPRTDATVTYPTACLFSISFKPPGTSPS